MKITKGFFLIVLAGVSSIASAKTIEMKVNGLVCAFCAQGVEKTLKSFKAADGVLVNLEHRLVAVHLKEGQDIADPLLKKAITDSGYKLVSIRRTDTPLATLRARVAGKKKSESAKQDHAGHGSEAHAH